MCGKKYIALFLSLFLVASPAFCGSFGWSFLDGSKTDSSTSVTKVNQPIEVIQKTTEIPQVLEEEKDLVMEEQSVQTPPTTSTTSQIEGKDLIAYFESNDSKMTEIYEKLENYEKSSFRTKAKAEEELVEAYKGLAENVKDSNIIIDDAVNLINDYELALEEVQKMHFGFGVSGIYNIENGYSGYLDVFARKNNAVFSMGVGYPIDFGLFNNPFDFKKVNYKVGVSWEF